MEIIGKWLVSLKTRRGKLTQVVSGETFDDAIENANKTFYARLYIDENIIAKEGQKIDNLTSTFEPLRFGFGAGHVTERPGTRTAVVQLLDDAQKRIIDLGWTEKGDIQECYFWDPV